MVQGLISFSYSIVQITQGLLVHPYQTMQALVQEKVFVWMSLLPSLFLAVVTIVWRFGIVPLVQLVFSCEQSGLGICEFLPFFSNWLTFFCIYWQTLLLYLLFRFSWAFSKELT
jgi:hypothetical protein